MTAAIFIGLALVSLSIWILAISLSECGDALDRIANNLNSANCIAIEKEKAKR